MLYETFYVIFKHRALPQTYLDTLWYAVELLFEKKLLSGPSLWNMHHQYTKMDIFTFHAREEGPTGKLTIFDELFPSILCWDVWWGQVLIVSGLHITQS